MLFWCLLAFLLSFFLTLHCCWFVFLCLGCWETRVYSLYADYVLKNPFYELDMPIRCELFDLQLTSEVTLTMNA